MEHLGSHLFSFSGSSAVSDRKVLDLILFDQCGQLGNGLFFSAFTESGIHDGGIQNFSCSVYDGYFASVLISGVESHGDLTLYGRLHQQWLTISLEIWHLSM